FFFIGEDGIRDRNVTGVQTCALTIYRLMLIYCGNFHVQTFLMMLLLEKSVHESFRNKLTLIYGISIAATVVLSSFGAGFISFIRSEERRVGKELRLRMRTEDDMSNSK